MKWNFIISCIIINSIYSFNLRTSDDSHSFQIKINYDKEVTYRIDPSKSYIFEIENEKYLYSLSSDSENIFYIKNKFNTFELKDNDTFFENGEKIYVNYYKNLTDLIFIKIYPAPIYRQLNTFETINKDQYFFIKTEEQSMLCFDSFDRN